MCDLKLDLLFDFSGHLAISRIVRKPLSHIKRGELRPFGLNAAPLQLDVRRSAFLLRFSYGETNERLPRRSLRRRRVGRLPKESRSRSRARARARARA